MRQPSILKSRVKSFECVDIVMNKQPVARQGREENKPVLKGTRGDKTCLSYVNLQQNKHCKGDIRNFCFPSSCQQLLLSRFFPMNFSELVLVFSTVHDGIPSLDVLNPFYYTFDKITKLI